MDHKKDEATDNYLVKTFSTVAPDDLLEFYVEMVNGSSEAEIPVTLLIDGFLVSGSLVGAQRFLRSTIENFHSADDDFKTSYQAYIKQKIDSYGTGSLGIAFFHLIHAKFYNSRIGLPDDETSGRNFRGLLSKVSGFYLGALRGA